MLDAMKPIIDLHNAKTPVDDGPCGLIHEFRQVLEQFSGFLDAGLDPQSGHGTVLAALIVANYVRRNEIEPAEVPHFVVQIRQALVDPCVMTGPMSASLNERRALRPAVPIEASVAPDFIICLEDGRSCKSLKRYLRDHYAMTPETYRARWGLPDTYPMVAPNFSRRRAEIARQNKLGRYERG